MRRFTIRRAKKILSSCLTIAFLVLPGQAWSWSQDSVDASCIITEGLWSDHKHDGPLGID
jgi:hypothetical protein